MAASDRGGSKGHDQSLSLGASKDTGPSWTWTAPPSMARSASEAKAQLPLFSKGYSECRDTLGKMSAKSRGVRCHNGPVQLRASWPARDCNSWARDKVNNPYCFFDMPTHSEVSPKPAKAPPPPRLWLPERNKAVRKKGSQGGAGGGAAKASSEAKRPWDTEHHIMFSRMNHEVQVGVREYFDIPRPKENEGVPKVREKYTMNDRQGGWNDEPAPEGEMRRTLFDNIGPFNLGGCKQQQLPSWWRKIENWHAYSAPDLKPEGGLSGNRNPTGGDRSLLAALADAPASQTTEFWRGWAKAQSPGALPKESSGKDWDNRWNVTWSKDNEFMNRRMREYFSVPHGKPGRSTVAPRRGRKIHEPLATPQTLTK